MALFLITGQSGTGKSTLLNEFKKLKLCAYGTDEDAIAGHKHVVSGKQFTKADYSAVKKGKIDWVNDTVFEIIPDRLGLLIEESASREVFLFGGADDISSYYDKFELVFVLELDDQAHEKRLLLRDNGNDYGKKPHELRHIFSKKKSIMASNSQASNLIRINALGSLSQVVKNIQDFTNKA